MKKKNFPPEKKLTLKKLIVAEIKWPDNISGGKGSLTYETCSRCISMCFQCFETLSGCETC
ncbi:hypothetical protein [Chitinophaga solisilvae]|uniref:hypothetical protein n=1 Tax=Chitinophaga solisilvae TaxID=1233460 RepID=UPI0013709AC3|nr:hypothetical protein [Chitinophaga solisilvae]